MTKANVSFVEWFELACKYGDLIMPLVAMGMLMFGAFVIGLMIPIIGLPTFSGLGIAFLLTLRYAWRQDWKNQVWYLTEHVKEARKNA